MKTTFYVVYAIILLVGGGYLLERYVTSNMERDLSLNSGRRESSSLINFSTTLSECESSDELLDILLLEKQTLQEGSQAWNVNQQSIQGIRLSQQECLSELQSIIDTTEIEQVPEFASLNQRYLEIK